MIRVDIPGRSIDLLLPEETIKERLSKFGGTQYFSKNIEINLDDGLILPASKINEMRRNAVSKLDEQEKIELQYKPFNVFLPKYISLISLMPRHLFQMQVKYLTITRLSVCLYLLIPRLRILLITGQELFCREGFLELNENLK